MGAGKGDRIRPVQDRSTFYSNFVRTFSKDECGSPCPHPQIDEPCNMPLNHTGPHRNGMIEWHYTEEQ